MHFLHAAEGDYVATTDTFTFNDLSLQMFCLDVGIKDDQLVEMTETFLVCATSDVNVTVCVSVNITDNDGMECAVNKYTQMIFFFIF